MSLHDEFQRDGAVVLRGVLTAGEIALLGQGMAANRAAPGPLAKVASAADDPGEFFEDFCNWTRNAPYERVLRESKLAEAAALLTGSTSVRLYHDHLLIKTAGTRTPTPWHQDQPYYNIEGRQTVSFWIPIDPVPREATLEFVAGSHLGPWLMPVSFRDREAKWFPPGALAPLPDIEADRAAWPIIGWALEPGDAVAFNMATLHAAKGSPTDRRVFSARFIGDDVRHAPRPWTTSPEFAGLDIPAGAPMDHPLFPVVWP
jgi:ectoine hydroxylase-related dioxygenase (phytanoyl-CoA dioxygenase family)